uniref:WD_REPEATS_REGION domain-containing protein n=1 Tax=Parastrongyloides trichosuri TaxID=131310 RepID=A0A0N5A2N2_PARTI
MDNISKRKDKKKDEKRKHTLFSDKDKERRKKEKKKSKVKTESEYVDDFEKDEEEIRKEIASTTLYEDDFEEDSDEDPEKLKEQVASSKLVERLNNRKTIILSEKKEEIMERPVTRSIRRLPQEIGTSKNDINISNSSSRIIDFDNARTIDLASISSSATRFSKFKNLIGMEPVTYPFEGIPPIKDYDFYMSMFGSTTKSQVGCQTGDDNKDVNIMTDGLSEKENFWCQVPELNQNNNWGREKEKMMDDDIKEKELFDENLLETYSKNHLNDDKLIKLVEAMDKFIRKVNEINEDKNDDGLILEYKSDFNFTYGYNELISQFYSDNASVTALHYRTSSMTSNKAILLYVSIEMEICKIDTKFNNCSFIFEYSTSNYKRPLRIFCVSGEVTSLCTSPNNDMALIVGTNSGTIVLFDLNENEKYFKKYQFNFENNICLFPIRLPSFDNSHESLNNAHLETNCSIISVYAFASKLDTTTFSLISLNEFGILTLWNVYNVEISTIEIETNFGVLRPSSALRMMKKEILYPLKASPSTEYSPTKVIANAMEVILFNKNINNDKKESIIENINILIATNKGYILNTTGSTSGIKKSSTFSKGLRLLKLLSDGKTFEITSLSISPFSSHLFGVGLCTGQIVIGSIYENKEKIILTPPASSKLIVSSIEWSPNENGIIYSIHNYNRLLIWNLNIETYPINVTDLSQSIGGNDIKIFTTKAFISHDGYSYLIFGLNNGNIQIHRLEKISKSTNNNENLDKIINNIIF